MENQFLCKNFTIIYTLSFKSWYKVSYVNYGCIYLISNIVKYSSVTHEKESFLIFMNVKTVVINNFVETVILFAQDFDKYYIQKDRAI